MALISCKVERVFYPREGETGEYYIIATDKGKVKGKMRWRPAIGEQLAMTGEWSEYQGQKEFKFKDAWHDLPTCSRDLLRYACELTKGLGAATETLIWETLGDDWQEIGDGDVPKVKGALLDRLQETIRTLKLEKEKTAAIAWLMGVGGTRNMGEVAWEQFGESMVGVVNADCYRLAELAGYSFKDVDGAIRLAFGIEDQDPRRVKAAVLYFLRQLTGNGPTVIPWWMLKDRIIETTALPAKLVAETVFGMLEDGTLRGFTATQMLSLTRDFENELDIWRFVGGK